MKRVYITADFKQFDDYTPAKRHEDQQFEEWYRTDRTIWLTSFMSHLDDDEVCDFQGTEREVFLDLLRKYWENLLWEQRKKDSEAF